jgi:hypothetical protein
VLNEQRTRDRQIAVNGFRGSGGVDRPESEDTPGRKNQDFFANMKAQGWWRLRQRFERTYRAIEKGAEFNRDEIISLSSDLAKLPKLCMELSQPTYSLNSVGKIVIDKAPEGSRSPNLADAVMIRFASVRKIMPISANLLKLASRPSPNLRRPF